MDPAATVAATARALGAELGFGADSVEVLLGGNRFFDPLDTSDTVFMPLEFSVAAFRFGHSMVRGEYDFNANFGRPGLAGPSATFFLIFAFTGKGGLRRKAEQEARKHLARQVPDPALRERLTPDYAIGCKRVLISNDYFPALSKENVELVTEVAPSPMDAAEALDLVGLGERRHHFPAQLSGGEQQRVAIARAIAKRPAVLLCDEPTGALDVATGVRVLEAIVHANERLGTTTLVITHNADIARIGDRVVRFADGLIRAVESNVSRVPAAELNW